MIAKARVAQSTACSSSFAAAGLAPIEGSALPWLKAPLFAVGPKLCGEGGIKCKHSPLGEGAPVRTLGRMRSVHPNRLCLPPIIETGRPSVPPLRAGVVSPRRATARAAPTALREPCLKSGGRVRTPTPTQMQKLSRLFRRGRTLAGPQMYAARPGGRALQPSTSRHLLVKARRGTETASAPIFHHARAQWPGGNLDTHSDFHAPEIL